MQLIQLLGSVFGLALVSGINLYATVLTVGLGIKFNLIQLPAGLEGLNTLTDPLILIFAGLLYLIEFVADKFPLVDSMWDSLHTFIRPIGAAIIGATAFVSLDPTIQFLVILACGGISLSSHSSKAGTRLAANQSPEPASNIVISIFEDIFVVTATAFFINHPVAAIVVVAVFIILFAFFAPKVYRLIKYEFSLFIGLIRRLIKHKSTNNLESDEIPKEIKNIIDKNEIGNVMHCIHGFIGSKCKFGRFSRTILTAMDDKIIIWGKKYFKYKSLDYQKDDIESISLQKRFLNNRIIIKTSDRKLSIIIPSDKVKQAHEFVNKTNELLTTNTVS